MLKIKPKKGKVENDDAFGILIQGAVQGVGFRPFIFRLASRMNLKGWVSNDSRGVLINVEGEKDKVYDFVSRIYEEKPPSAFIETIQVDEIEYFGYDGFEIKESVQEFEKMALVLPDIATCPDCLEELFNVKDRRYLYPFINCTQCGPRFTIIKDIPYDRKNSTMDVFSMCQRCEKEYSDSSNRRFHAQPNGCWECGPEIKLVTSYELQVTGKGEGAIEKAAQLIKEGHIIAIKSLGGYQLACNAHDEEVVKKLRQRKGRISKPFALMAKSIAMVEDSAQINDREKTLLLSFKRPILLLRKKTQSKIAASVAPDNKYLGFMLPYTPMHYVLCKYIDTPLVMTSGNIAEEPIVYKDIDAFDKLKDIADYFLIHDREINIRCDDSVTRVFLSLDGDFNKEYIIRRARGYAPNAISLDYNFKTPLLAVGAYLKNTIACAKDNHVFVSQHIGDLDSVAATDVFQESILHYEKLFEVEPEIIVADMHPEYYSTKYAKDLCEKNNKKLITVQHHHAHIASCMIENNLRDKVLGVAFDGTGYGLDSTIWGGEIMIADLKDFSRLAHLEYLPQPGAEKAIKYPRHMALSWLYHAYKEELFNLDIGFIKKYAREDIHNVITMLKGNINSPLTSSMGRLFASVSSMLGLCDMATFEGEAEIKLEQIQDEYCKEAYIFDIDKQKKGFIISASGVIKEIVNDLKKAVSNERIAAKFHNGIVEMLYKLLIRLRRIYKIDKVCLTGGVFQNFVLLTRVYDRLTSKGFKVYIQGRVPANDGGVSLGQVVIANELL